MKFRYTSLNFWLLLRLPKREAQNPDPPWGATGLGSTGSPRVHVYNIIMFTARHTTYHKICYYLNDFHVRRTIHFVVILTTFTCRYTSYFIWIYYFVLHGLYYYIISLFWFYDLLNFFQYRLIFTNNVKYVTIKF